VVTWLPAEEKALAECLLLHTEYPDIAAAMEEKGLHKSAKKIQAHHEAHQIRFGKLNPIGQTS
jgi:hypothetical protein